MRRRRNGRRLLGPVQRLRVTWVGCRCSLLTHGDLTDDWRPYEVLGYMYREGGPSGGRDERTGVGGRRRGVGVRTRQDRNWGCPVVVNKCKGEEGVGTDV